MDKRHGKGEWFDVDGSKLSGTYINDKEDGEFIFTNPNGAQ